MVGHPNVGKSALLNALMGRRRSVKSTPGHKTYPTVLDFVMVVVVCGYLLVLN